MLRCYTVNAFTRAGAGGTPAGVDRDTAGLSAAHIAAECERSLARLQLDTIDIYYAHKPDENGVPLKERPAELIVQVRLWIMTESGC